MTANSPTSLLSAAEVGALLEALDDEYRAWATYDQVIADFGPERPFINIRDAEARHIQALLPLFERYGIPVPNNPWRGKLPHYPDLQSACAAGVTAEIENAALYDRLNAATTRPDILDVFARLRDASQERHLPAFQRCAERRGGEGAGRGQGRRTHGHAERCRAHTSPENNQ
ncbi:DUF2202 domain-containing protein [Sinimarinibacterium sp. CAU 1509]|uniref:ferritin-like domain-containing protein n=1 Tax=Sinimarinibacterium sp. CAU 1509 TaxID=2562283 RepID=UPI0010ACF4CB|nr:DUF2202 domain-containing protein [Sinimarinibacterium sp. CAU 1509]TJY59843.1 DUF2202 domain-containing protein [Sinimarinibacterium sp. CAU 1509]